MKKGIDYIAVGVVNLCHDGGGRYLLGLRSDKCRDEHFTWDPVGSGGVEVGESIHEAVVREVKEETGADAVSVQQIGWRETFREIQGQTNHWLQFDNLVLIDPSQVYNPEPEKCLELRWCTLAEFPKELHSQFPGFLKKYKDIL